MNMRAVVVLTLFLLFASTAGTAAAQTQIHEDARAIVERLADSMRVDDVRTIEITGSGTTRAFGQQFTAMVPDPDDPNAGDDFPTLAMPRYTRIIDYQNMYSRIELTRAQGDYEPRGGGGQPIVGEQTQITVNYGPYAWNEQGGNMAPQPNEAELRQIEIYLTPYGFVKGALEADDVTAASMMMTGSDTAVGKQAGPDGMRKVTYIAYTALDKYKISGSMDENYELERIYTWIGDPVLGDINWGYDYREWRDFDGIRHPARLHPHWGDIRNLPHHGTEVLVSELRVNVPAPRVDVPDNVRSASAAIPQVESDEVAPGVWRIAGGSHHTIAVEFDDFISVIEAPQDEARSLAVIREIQRVIPEKPIRYLVVTHSHFDHMGGIRTYVAHGAILILHENLREFVDQLVLYPYPRTVEPDLLSTYYPRFLPNKLPQYETITPREADGRKFVVSDGAQIMELHAVTGLQHAGDMIMAYLPQARILVQADMYSPREGVELQPNQSMTALRNNIDRLGLDVDRHVPIHGRVATHEEFLSVVPQTGNN